MDNRHDPLQRNRGLTVRSFLKSFLALASVAATAVFITRMTETPPREVAAQTAANATTPQSNDAAPTSTTLAPTDLVLAKDAAVAAVAMTDEVVSAGFISRRDLVARFATPSFAPQLADRTAEQVNVPLGELGKHDADMSRVRLVEQPLTATARAVEAGAQVEIWSVLVIAAPGLGPARQMWHTVTLSMTRTGGRWLVDGWDSRVGPTPALAPEVRLDAAEIVAERLNGARVTTAGS